MAGQNRLRKRDDTAAANQRIKFIYRLVGRKYGVSDGFRNASDPHPYQQDQALTSADPGKLEQEIRKSATSRNQESGGKEVSITIDLPPDSEELGA